MNALSHTPLFQYIGHMCISRFTAQAKVILLLFGAVGIISTANADIYKYVDDKGRTYYTNRPPHDGYQLIFKSNKRWRGSKIDYRNMEKNRQRFTGSIARVAQTYGIPEGLIHAVIAIESAYDPNAESRRGAIGLMQLMPETARRYGVTNRRDPSANLSGGTRYLKDLLKRFNNRVELALAGYNAGENAVEKYGKQIPPFVETQSYVRKVMELYQQYPQDGGDA
jgi:soluble lytic murein transglycosylase-like protein